MDIQYKLQDEKTLRAVYSNRGVEDGKSGREGGRGGSQAVNGMDYFALDSQIKGVFFLYFCSI